MSDTIIEFQATTAQELYANLQRFNRNERDLICLDNQVNVRVSQERLSDGSQVQNMSINQVDNYTSEIEYLQPVSKEEHLSHVISLVHLKHAQAWNDSFNKYGFCLNFLDLQDTDENSGIWVIRLQKQFTQLLGEHHDN